MRSFSFCIAVVLLGIASPMSAAPPVVTTLFPAGAARGSTTEVALGGTFTKWPVQVWCNSPQVKCTPGKAKNTIQVVVDAGATPGLVYLRFHDAEGVSGLKPFQIGTIPDIAEKEPNDAPKTAQVVALPRVVNGRLEKNGDVDCFAVSLKKGETLVAHVDAEWSFQSPMDSVLQVVSTDGFILEQNHDARRLDPQLAFTAPRDGNYIVRIFAFPSNPDSSIRFAGGDAYIYRLTLTTGPFIEAARQLALPPSDKPVPVELKGINLPGNVAERTISVSVPKDAETVELYHPKWAGSFSARVEASKNLVFGTLTQPGAIGSHKFEFKKAQPILVQVESRALGFPLVPRLRVLGPDGKVIIETEVKDVSKDCELTFTPKVDGTHTIEVHEQTAQGGSRFHYRLRAEPVVPSFEITVASDRFTVSMAKPLEIPVKVLRKRGFKQEIELNIDGLPDGATSEVITAKGKADPNTLLLRISATKPASGVPLQIRGQAKGIASPSVPVRGTSAELGTSTTFLWLSVTK